MRAPADVEDLIEATAHTDREHYGRHLAVRIEQEPGAGGRGWSDSIIRTRLGTFDALAVPSKGDKYDRMRPFAARVSSAHARLVRSYSTIRHPCSSGLVGAGLR